MQKIDIKNFGKIKKLNLVIKDITILTGEQTSGKSTVAKCIYYFKTLPNDILAFLLNYKQEKQPKIQEIENYLAERFNNLWSILYYSKKTKLKFYYSENCSAVVNFTNPDSPVLNFSDKIKKELTVFLNSTDFRDYEMQITTNYDKISVDYITKLKSIFQNKHDDIVYIPAGRSVTLKIEKTEKGLTNFNDYFLNLFSERINQNIEFLKAGFTEKTKNANKLISDLLKAKVVFEGNEIYLEVDKNKRFGLTELSSGQEEVLWLVSLLNQFMNENHSRYIFIEEPETNLYPTSQKDIIMLIALFLNSNKKHQILVTTHSPYVLSVFSNLFLAKKKYENAKNKEAVKEILNENFWLDIDNATALMFNPNQNEPKNCIDKEYTFIELGSVDAVAEEINNLFYELDKIAE